MLYKALGFAVWKGAKWYVGRKLPPARLLAGVGLAAVAVTAVAVGAKRRPDGHPRARSWTIAVTPTATMRPRSTAGGRRRP